MTSKTKSVNEKQTRPRLVRSCEACVKAKRKCSYELPTCARCRVRQTKCYYANAPLTAAYPVSGHVRDRSREPDAGSPEYDTLLASASLTCIRLAGQKVIVQVDSDTVYYMTGFAKRHIYMYDSFNATLFVHSDLPQTQLAKNVKAICRASLSQSEFNEPSHRKLVAEIDHQFGAIIMRLRGHVNVYDMLSIVQALILLQIVSLLLLQSKGAFLQRAQTRQRLLQGCTERLYFMAPSQLPATLSAREAFLLAESIRRTMLVSTEFCLLHEAIAHGWVELSPLADSLPFERRASLWDMTEAEFHTAFGKGQQEMISWREFADTFDNGQLSEDSLAPLELLLLVAAKGKPAVDRFFKKCLQYPHHGQP